MLTYEDVTSIDSVGIITAQKDIHVGAGISVVGVGSFGSLDISGDLDVDGHTNLDNVSIAGVTTTTDDIIIGADNKKLKLGAGEELQLYQAGNHSIIQHNGSHYLLLRSNAFAASSADGTKNMFAGFPDTHSSMYYNGSYKIRTQNTGAEIVGTVVATGADINGDLDVDGHTNLDNVSVAGVSTFSGDVTIDAGTNTTLTVEADTAGVALFKATGGSGAQATAALELIQGTTSQQGGGISYNGDGSPAYASGETADHVTFFRMQNGSRTEVFSYPYNSDNVVFNGSVTASSFSGSLGANNLTGTITGSVQSNITQLGTLGSLTVSGTINPFNVTHTSGNCAQFNRSGKTVSINANYAAGNSFSDIGLTSGMDLKFSLGGSHKIVFKSAGHIEPETDSQINLGSNTKRFANVYADTLYGDGSNLTGIAADKIFEGNTEVETVDTGSDGHVKITTEGSERARITSAGKFLIGTSTPQGNANADDLVVSTSGHSGITIRSGTSSNGNIFFADGTSGGDEYRGVIDYNHSSNHMSFSTNAVERVRIDSSGNLMIGSSSAEAKLDVTGGVSISSNGVTVSPSGYDLKIRSNTAKLGIHIDNASGTPILEFGIGGATGGRITTNTSAGPIIIAPNNVERLRIAADGQVLPGADDAQNLGSSTKRWKNIYAADMHFSNEGKTNDVDGTWGDWTLQEGEDSVFMINNRTGKKYAITMREVN